MKKELKNLMIIAMEARKYSYCPYSNYSVGAALLCKDGRVIMGSNIENASYGATNCAERTAVFKAISEGERDFEAIAIVGGKNLDFSDCDDAMLFNYGDDCKECPEDIEGCEDCDCGKHCEKEA